MDLRPGLHDRRDLLAAGLVDGELRRAVRAGRIALLRPGAYLAGPRPESHEARHALLVHATAARLAADAVVSHVSAPVLYGLPVWNIPLGRVHVTRDRGSGGRCDRLLHVHVAPLEPHEVRAADGVAVTSPARAVVDVARTAGFEEAMVVADAALHARLVTPAELAAALERAAGWRGIPAAPRVVAFADGRAESPGETRSRIAIARAGLPVPVLQWPVHSDDGDALGYADFAWPELGTVGEFDGLAKYGRLRRPGESPEQALVREKHREDAFRAEDLWVTRWVWSDLDRFEPVVDRIRRGFARRERPRTLVLPTHAVGRVRGVRSRT